MVTTLIFTFLCYFNEHSAIISDSNYSRSFKSKTGNVAKPFRMALGARIIQMKYDPPFDPCLMVAFRKRIDLDVSFFLNEEFLKKHNGKNMNIAWLCSQRK